MRIRVPGEEPINVDLWKVGYYAFVTAGAVSVASWIPADAWHVAGPLLIIIGMVWLAVRLNDGNSQADTVEVAKRVAYYRMVDKKLVTSDPLIELERHMRTVTVDPLPDAA